MGTRIRRPWGTWTTEPGTTPESPAPDPGFGSNDGNGAFMAVKSGNTTKKQTAVKKVVKMKPRTAEAAAPAKAAKQAKAPKAENRKFIGKTTGMRVQAFQDKLMKDNYRAKLDDATLAKTMRDEFPNAVSFTEKHVAGIRSQWNHGHRPSQEGVAPDKALAKFDEEGQVVNPRARAAKAEKPAKGKKAKASKRAAAPEPEEEEDEVDDDDEGEDEDEDEYDEAEG